MALEINEIGIHFRVPDAERPAGGRDERAPASATCAEPDHERIVDDCVRRVLRLLNARAER